MNAFVEMRKMLISNASLFHRLDNIELKQLQANQKFDAHDRFLIVDQTELYHIGASLKDLGKKWFAFSRMDIEVSRMLNLLHIL